MVYKRVPGGEKTEKTGVPWTKDELNQVYKLFEKLEGIGIHEHNPEIQNLAKTLKRGVRATEAQLLMFRALSRGKEYSRKNMNKLCEDIWEEEQEKYNIRCMKNDLFTPDLFTMQHNAFLIKLLDLAQDGRGSISGPANWLEKPLLYVETELDTTIEEFADSLIKGEETGRWLFLVGAPGNGKSALTGRLVRKLIENQYSFFTYSGYSQGGDKIEYDFTNKNNPLPYKVEVYDKSNKFSICSIIQDATVLRELGKNSNPAEDLVYSLCECLKVGRSAVICANRGVLEDSHRKLTNHYFENKIDIETIISLKTIIDHAIKQQEYDIDVNAPKSVFKKININSFSLEQESFFNTGNKIFEKLVLKAIEAENWKPCQVCDTNSSCPFYQNKQSLHDTEIRNKFLNILNQFESYSGQTIVFREAIALLSFCLAGNTDDYKNYDNDPCMWVKEMNSSNQWFTLLTRRLYNTIYNPHRPFGIYDKEVTQIQKINSIEIQKVSSKIGLTRFYSLEGIAEEIHPEKNPRIDTKVWDTAIIGNFKDSTLAESLIGYIEINAFGTWQNILDKDGITNTEDFRLIKRWISANVFNIRYFVEGKTRFTEELIKLTPFFGKDKLNKELSKELEETLSKLIKTEKIPITSTASISNLPLKIEINPIEKNNRRGDNPLGLHVSFSTNTMTFLDCRTLCFLLYKASTDLNSMTFPVKLLDRVEISQITAARTSEYNTKSDIKIHIDYKRQEKKEFERYKGEF